MRVTSLLRNATLTLSLVAATGLLTVSTVAANAAQTQPQAQQSSPYDSPNFVIPESNIYS